MEFLYILITSPSKLVIADKRQIFRNKLLQLFDELNNELNLKLIFEDFEWGNDSVYSDNKVSSIEKIINHSTSLFINFISSSEIHPNVNVQYSLTQWQSHVLLNAHASGNDKCFFLYCNEEPVNSDEVCPPQILYNGRICVDQIVEVRTDNIVDIKPELYQWIIKHISYSHPDAFLLADQSLSGLINRQSAYFLSRSHDSLVDPILTKEIWKWCEEASGKIQVYLSNSDTPLRKVVEDSCLVASRILQKNPGTFVIFHKASLDPDSSDIKLFLARVLREFSHKVNKEDLPLNIDQLGSNVAYYLQGQFTKFEKLYLFVIGADQFRGEKYAAQIMNWIPKTLSANVNIFLVMSFDSHQFKSLISRNQPPLLVRASADLPDRVYNSEGSNLTSESKKKLSFISDIQLSKMNIMQKLQEVINNLWETSLPHDYIRRVPLTMFALLATSARGCLQRNELLCMLNRISYLPDDPFGGSCQLKESSEPVVIVNECGDGDFAVEKDQFECSEKSVKLDDSLPPKARNVNSGLPNIRPLDLSDWVAELERAAVIQQFHIPETGVSWISIQSDDGIVSVKELIENSNWMQPYDEKKKFWAVQLTSFFNDCVSSIERKMEELPHLLTIVDNSELMIEFLCDIRVIERLYCPHSISLELLKLWRIPLGHETDYKELLLRYRSLASVQLEIISNRQGDVNKAKRNTLMLTRILVQAGHFTEAKELTRTLLKSFVWNEILDEYEAPTYEDSEILSEVYFLLFEIMDERLKICDFIRPQHNHLLKRALLYGSRALIMSDEKLGFFNLHMKMKSLSVSAEPEEHRPCLRLHRVAIYLMRLAFALDGWEHCGVCRLYDDRTIRKAATHMLVIAIQTFRQLKDRQLIVECLMTRAVIEPRRRFSKKYQLYTKPLEDAGLLYGEQHMLIFRLYINIGICYEESEQFIKAFRYFSRWSQCTEMLLGANHPKTKRTYGVFREPKFQSVASYFRSLNGQKITDSMENLFNQSLASTTDSEFVGNEPLSMENAMAASEDLEEELALSDDETSSFFSPFSHVINVYLNKPGAYVSNSMSLNCSQYENTPAQPSNESLNLPNL